jgi:hypothetical protein
MDRRRPSTRVGEISRHKPVPADPIVTARLMPPLQTPDRCLIAMLVAGPVAGYMRPRDMLEQRHPAKRATIAERDGEPGSRPTD